MKVSMIAGILKERDAISSSTIDKALALQEICKSLGVELELQVFVNASDYDLGGCIRIASSPNEIIFDEHFLTSELIIYDFGIYYNLFDTIHLAPAQATKMVHYHNITPAELSPADNKESIEISFVQRLNILKADIVMSGSRFNREDLVGFGVAEEDICYLNYSVDYPVMPDYTRLGGEKQSRGDAAAAQSRARETAGQPGFVEALYVGRYVHSKGLHDLLGALRLVIDNGASNIRLRLIGSHDLSDSTYFEELPELIGELGLADHVYILEGLPDEERDYWYRRSDLFVTASYHEGFCIPVIEALRHGCYVIAYDAGNLPHVVNGLGNVVETGDVEALAAKISDYVREKSSGKPAADIVLQTDAGNMSEDEFRRRGLEYSREFSFESLKANLLEILRAAALVSP